MPKTEAALKAQKKYTQTEKGKKAVEKARKKQATTEEYRAYQREKQREYRERRKLQASGEQAQSESVAEVVPATKGSWVKLPIEIDETLRSLPNRSEYIRDAVVEKLRKDGLLQLNQDGGN